MDSKINTKQQDFDDLMQHIESIYDKEQIAVMCEYADSSRVTKEEFEIVTVSNSSVYGY